MQIQNGDLTAYEILQVHPAAPLDLITAAYWRLAGRAQAERATSEPSASAALWMLTRAYEVLSRPASRSAHDQHYGILPQPLAPKVPSRRKGLRLLKRRELAQNGDPNVDYYEILRVAPGAEQPVIEDAYGVLRNLYIRLVKAGSEPSDLIDCLEEAWAITSDAERRRRYDEARQRRNGSAPVPTEPGRSHSTPVHSTSPVPADRENGRSGTSPAPRRPRFEAHDAPPEPIRGTPEPATGAEPSAAPVTKARPKRKASSTAETAEKARRGEPEPSPVALSSAGAVRAATRNGEAPSGAGLWHGLAGSASSLMRTVGRQWRTMSKKEMEQVQEVAEQRHRESPVDIDQEEALVQRLSSRSTLTEGPSGNGEGRTAVRLELVEGRGRGESYELDRFPLTLGGGEDCDIVLPGLAQQRARLLYRDGRFVVYTLVGLEGTEADPNSAPWWILESGEDLRLGPYTLRFTARAD